MNGPSLRVSGIRKGDSPKRALPNHVILSDFNIQRFSDLSLDIHTFTNTKDGNSQLDYVKNLSQKIKNAQNDQSKDIMTQCLINIFLESPLKHPIRNVTSKLLFSQKSYFDKIALLTFSELLNLISTSNFENGEAVNNLTNSIYGCFDVLPQAVDNYEEILSKLLIFLKQALSMYSNILSGRDEMAPTKKMECYSFIHNANRLLILILQKFYTFHYSIQISNWKEIFSITNNFINCEDLPMDNRANCCIILILLMRLQFGPNAWIDVLKYIFSINDGETEISKTIQSLMKSTIIKIGICTAIINTISLNDICNSNIENKNALCFISSYLVVLSTLSSVDPLVILSITRGIFLISKTLHDIEDPIVGIEISNILLGFVWSHLDYYVDSVQHLTVQILSNIVKFASILDKEGNNQLSRQLIDTILNVSNNQNINYRALIALGSEYSCSFLLQCSDTLVDNILSSIGSSSDSLNISTAFEVLMARHYNEVSLDIFFTTWINPVLQALIHCEYSTQDESSLTLTALRGILLKAVKLDSNIVPSMIQSFIQNDTEYNFLSSDGHFKCALVCLNVARKVGFLDSAGYGDDNNSNLWKGIIAYDILDCAMVHQVAEIRILAYGLIVDSHKTTEYFTENELTLIENFLSYNINTNVPSFRQNLYGITKKLFYRWENSYLKAIKIISDLIKNNEDSTDLEEHKHITKFYEKFLRCIFAFCLKNIFPGANFSRRNISMQILVWCQEILDRNKQTSNSIKCTFWKKKHVQVLFEQLDDSYECNKQLAIKLLLSMPIEHELFMCEKIWHSNILDIITKASSIKPTDCITSAYKLELLITKHPHNALDMIKITKLEDLENKFKEAPFALHYHTILLIIDLLKKEIKIAEENILTAAANGPIYGLLFCLRHILGMLNFKSIGDNVIWTHLMDSIIKLCFKINELVSPIVNNSSPEGHLPMDFNAGSMHMEGNGIQLENGKFVTAQMVLLCGWRSVKEVSLLLGDIALRGIIAEDTNGENILDGTITKQNLFDIGEHFMTLLSETKHRGAFEQAYVGFSKLCLRLWKCQSKDLHSLPNVWLNDLISAIASGDSKNSKLCATRRSAGVPFIIQALVTTELQVNDSSESFQICMSTLLQLASYNNDISVETRTHCLNILRALFRHAALGEQVNAYVADGLMISISGFNGATWAERNSSTLLFSSLVTRVFGVQRTKDSEQLCIRNKMTGRIFFLRYPKLYDFFLNHLKAVKINEESKDLLQPSLYPVLLLLSRLYPSSLEGTDSYLQLVAFVPYLIRCSGSCVLKIRQLASKAVVPLIVPERYLGHLNMLFSLLDKDAVRTNYCHGILLQIIKLLQSFPESLQVDTCNLEIILNALKNCNWILLQVFNKSNPCFVIGESYLEVVLLFTNRFPHAISLDKSFFDQIKGCLEEQIKEMIDVTFGKEHFYVQALHLNIQLTYVLHKHNIAELIFKYLENSSYEVITVLINYLLCLFNSENIKDINGKFEIGHIEKTFVAKLTPNEKEDILKNIVAEPQFRNNLLKHYDDHKNFQYREKIFTILLKLPYKFDEISIGASSYDAILADYLEKYESEHEHLNYIYIKYIDKLLQNVTSNNTNIYEKFNHENIRRLSDVLMKNSFSYNDYTNKIAVIELILNNWTLFDWEASCINKSNYTNILLQWTAVFQLVSDDDENVSQKISNLLCLISQNNPNKTSTISQYNCVLNENKSRELLLQMFTNWMIKYSIHHTIAMLIIIAIGENDSSMISTEENQVFEKGEKNESQEEYALTLLCVNLIKKVIANSFEGLSKIGRIEILQNTEKLLKSIELLENFGIQNSDLTSICDVIEINEIFTSDCTNFKIRKILKTLHKLFQ